MEIGFNVLIFVIKWSFSTAEIQMRFETIYMKDDIIPSRYHHLDNGFILFICHFAPRKFFCIITSAKNLTQIKSQLCIIIFISIEAI